MLLEKYPENIVLPVDLAYLDENGKRVDKELSELPKEIGSLDVGKKSADMYYDIIMNAKTVFVNGPLGVFEKEETEYATKRVWDALGDTPAYTVLGGGDSITATNKYNKKAQINYICTGGGALIRFLTGEELPVVKALRHGSKI